VDYKKRRAQHAPIHTVGAADELVERFRFLGVQITYTWYGNSTALDRMALQRVVQKAQYITGAEHPTIQDFYFRRCERKFRKIIKDSSHSSHRLFSLLPHGKWYRSTKSSHRLSSLLPHGKWYQSTKSSHRLFSLLPHGKWYRSTKSSHRLFSLLPLVSFYKLELSQIFELVACCVNIFVQYIHLVQLFMVYN
jgi:hypothetical protein